MASPLLGRCRRPGDVEPSVCQCLRHVLGIPHWPLRIRLPDLLLVLAVRGRGALKRLQHEAGNFRLEQLAICPSRKTFLDFLNQPAVAVRIGKSYERAIVAGFWGAAWFWSLRSPVEHVRYADPTAPEISVSLFYIVHDKIRILKRAWSC